MRKPAVTGNRSLQIFPRLASMAIPFTPNAFNRIRHLQRAQTAASAVAAAQGAASFNANVLDRALPAPGVKLMPLTPNAINRIRQTYRRVFQGRATFVTLCFADGSTRLTPCIWRQQDLNDPELLPQAKPPNNPQQATADAAFEVLTDEVDIATLQSAIYVVPQPYGGSDDPGIASRYLIIAVQPKGMGFPPVRAYVQLRRT